jgi:hypothetical protein
MLYGKILLDADPGGGVKLRTERPSYLSRLLEQQPPGKLRFFAGFVAAHPAPGEPAPEQNPEDIAVGIVLGCIERAWAKAEDDGKAKAEAEAAAKKK